MMRLVLLLAFVAIASAFMGAGKTSARRSVVNMGIDEFIGTPVKGEGGFFDPLNLSRDKDDATLRWYRAAELKHGRVCMLASLGIVIQGLDTNIIPNENFHETNAFAAVANVYNTMPLALIQILIAISAVEVLCASIENNSDRPGDFGWDPCNIRPKDPEVLDRMQVRELKNGRLAMLATAGMAYQTYLTGQGTLEQLGSGHISPFGDGQGVF